MTGERQSAGALGSTYDDEFFAVLDRQVRGSAEVIVPIVLGLLHPTSVLDVGCGRGTWLSVFRGAGIDDVIGVDGPHIAVSDLEIPPEQFIGRDLSQPFDLGRRFDLAVSLEVAEHLPAEVAPAFVNSLVAHAPAVLFSAAIPFQGGAGHVNERWPSYWAEQFAAHGFVPLDVVRPAVWADDRVAFWYAQNTLLYVDEHRLAVDALPSAVDRVLDRVHPALHERDHTKPKGRSTPPSLRRSLRDVRTTAWRALRERVPGA